MLNISIEDVNFNFSEKEYKGKNWKSKLVYKNSYYDNAKLVRILISDYIKKNNIFNYELIPEEIRNFKIYSHELIINESYEFNLDTVDNVENI